jgi:hypothetical protein
VALNYANSTILKISFMKKIFIYILLISGPFFILKAQPQTEHLVEDISISTRDNKRLSGTLSIPSSLEPSSPIVIFVAAPQPVDRNYHGIYSAIADSLARNGIVSFRFDNRASSVELSKWIT